MNRGAALIVAFAALTVAALGPAGARANDQDGRIELVGVFHAGGVIRGAAIHEGYLFLSTPDRLAIYNLRDPADPQRQAMVVSPRMIHGELLTTNGELLLLNEQSVTGGLSLRTVDVWDVEDKSNPKLVGSLPGVPDEHVSCILDCTWAYGSMGTIIDLRTPSDPDRRSENWMDIAGVSGSLHRVDEFRDGFVAAAPRGWGPAIYDVRDPLRPRVVARTRYPKVEPTGFLYSDPGSVGKGRYLFSSVEFPSGNDCDDPQDGALIAFDLRRRGSPVVSRFSAQVRDGCTGFYFSFHPNFRSNGLIALPQSMGGVRIVRFQPGKMQELATFAPPVTDMWLTFWIDEEFFYALSETGEIYILRFVP